MFASVLVCISNVFTQCLELVLETSVSEVSTQYMGRNSWFGSAYYLGVPKEMKLEDTCKAILWSGIFCGLGKIKGQTGSSFITQSHCAG